MRGKFFLVLFLTIIIGIQPVFAQSKSEAPAKPAAPEKTVKETKETGTVININLASDGEFTQALQTAGDVELVNEETEKAAKAEKNAKTEKNDKTPNQGKSK